MGKSQGIKSLWYKLLSSCESMTLTVLYISRIMIGKSKNRPSHSKREMKESRKRQWVRVNTKPSDSIVIISALLSSTTGEEALPLQIC
jgi:hypothetical protein